MHRSKSEPSVENPAKRFEASVLIRDCGAVQWLVSKSVHYFSLLPLFAWKTLPLLFGGLVVELNSHNPDTILTRRFSRNRSSSEDCRVEGRSACLGQSCSSRSLKPCTHRQGRRFFFWSMESHKQTTWGYENLAARWPVSHIKAPALPFASLLFSSISSAGLNSTHGLSFTCINHMSAATSVRQTDRSWHTQRDSSVHVRWPRCPTKKQSAPRMREGEPSSFHDSAAARTSSGQLSLPLPPSLPPSRWYVELCCRRLKIWKNPPLKVFGKLLAILLARWSCCGSWEGFREREKLYSLCEKTNKENREESGGKLAHAMHPKNDTFRR